MAGAIGSFVDTLRAGEAAVGEVANVVGSLNGARSVIITIANNTSLQLQLFSSEHAHGGFSVSPPGIISSMQSAVFGSQSTAFSVATGTEGSVSYQGDGLVVTCSWDNPFLGTNSSSVSRSGPNQNKFFAVATSGVGNERAPTRFDIFEIETKGFNVSGAILDKWAAMQWGMGPLGFPTSDEGDTDDGGRIQHFEHGSLVLNSGGDVEVQQT